MRKLHHSIVKRINGLLRPEYSIVSRGGARFLLNKHNWIDSRLLGFRRYEKANLAAMRSLLAAHGIRLFYDIGANFGYFSVLLARNGPVGEAHAFEPIARNYYQLCANILLNGLVGTVHAHHAALGAKTEAAQAWYDETSTGIATLDVEGGVRSRGDYNACESVACRRFDDAFAPEGRKALVKIDVEGFEMQVLEGMREALSRNRLLLFIESHNHAAQVEAFLAQYGYRRLDVAAEDYVFSNF